MTENQSVDQAAVVTPVTSGRARWRTMVQVPLLLVAAAGLGFAGQQMWQKQASGGSLFHNASGEFQCPIAAMFGCGAKASMGSCAAESMSTVAVGGCCSSGESCTAGEDCCAAMLQAAEAATSEAPVSAMSPANVVETL